MAQKTSPLLPITANRLRQFGERLHLARLRRSLTAKQVAERAGMTTVTLRNLERGGSGVTIGAFLAVMQVLGVEQDIDLLVKEDGRGRDLQDTALLPRSRQIRHPRPSSGTTGIAQPHLPSTSGAVQVGIQQDSLSSLTAVRFVGSDFVSTGDLAALIDIAKPAERKNKK